MKKQKKYLALGITVLLSLSGCSKPSDTIIEYKPTVIEKHQNKGYDSKTVEFNLGNKELLTSTNAQMPYKLRGTLSMPTGEGKFPVVFIVHGNHNNDVEDKRYDTGFEYLTKKLAENGYIAIALDLNQAYIWKYGDNDEVEKITDMTKEHIKVLKEANAGVENGYPIDLKNKIDMKKIGLVGHSRGGEIIVDLANELINQGENVLSLLAIAPAAVRANVQYLKNDIDTAILVPELDGDVISLDGYGIYDILASKKRETLLSLTLLENANHNYFNRSVDRNDAIIWKSTKNIEKQLSREEQEDFTGNFAVDFFNASMKGEIKNTIYDNNISSIFNMYGYNVKSLLSGENIQSIIAVDNVESFEGEDIVREATQYSVFFKDNKTEGLNIPATGNEIASIKKLINLKWDKLGSKVSFNPNINDFSKHNSLQMDIMVDPSDKLNKVGENQSFTIQLKDKKGNTSNVEVGKDVSALDYIDGKLEMTEVFDDKVYYWSNPTPLTSIKLPLNIFEGIDLNNIDEISLIFDKTNSGSIMISKIEVD